MPIHDSFYAALYECSPVRWLHVIILFEVAHATISSNGLLSWTFQHATVIIFMCQLHMLSYTTYRITPEQVVHKHDARPFFLVRRGWPARLGHHYEMERTSGSIT